MQRATGRVALLVLGLVAGLLAGCAEEKPTEAPEAGDQAIAFADPNLEAAVREAIGKPTGDILQSDVAGLSSLIARGRGIASLEGIQHLTALTWLKLGWNEISDLTPLSGLTALTGLDLDDNQISDLAPLSGLTALTALDVSSNDISDLAPLSALTALTALCLWSNEISDLAPLLANTGLGEGDWVELRENSLSGEAISVQIPALQARGVTVYY